VRLDQTCIECLLSRVRYECRLCGAGSVLTERTVVACSDLIGKLRGGPLFHPQIASAVHREAYRILGDPDPFAGLKEESNREALAVCREVRPTLVTFRDYVLASIIANTFDYGVLNHHVTTDFSASFRREFYEGLAIDDTDRILARASRVVYFTDNCGEIVFDRLLAGFLHARGSEITLAVRDEPILNDATMADAIALGFPQVVDRLTTTGAGCEIGVRPDLMGDDLWEAVEDCTLVIAKGMANFESLYELPDLPPVAYLMAVKCEPVGEAAGAPKGSRVAMLWE
jgi:uncharacterized protein with ATP-grasp and redox domains